MLLQLPVLLVDIVHLDSRDLVCLLGIMALLIYIIYLNFKDWPFGFNIPSIIPSMQLSDTTTWGVTVKNNFYLIQLRLT